VWIPKEVENGAEMIRITSVSWLEAGPRGERCDDMPTLPTMENPSHDSGISDHNLSYQAMTL